MCCCACFGAGINQCIGLSTSGVSLRPNSFINHVSGGEKSPDITIFVSLQLFHLELYVAAQYFLEKVLLNFSIRLGSQCDMCCTCGPDLSSFDHNIFKQEPPSVSWVSEHHYLSPSGQVLIKKQKNLEINNISDFPFTI